MRAFVTATIKIYVTVKDVVDIYVSVVHCFGNSECAGHSASLSTSPSAPPSSSPSSSPSSPPTSRGDIRCWSAAYVGSYLQGNACGDDSFYDDRDAAEKACIKCGSSCYGITKIGTWRWAIRADLPLLKGDVAASYVRVPCS